MAREVLARGPYQKNTPLAVNLEPVFYRLQIKLFTNWAIPAIRKLDKTLILFRESVIPAPRMHLTVCPFCGPV